MGSSLFAKVMQNYELTKLFYWQITILQINMDFMKRK